MIIFYQLATGLNDISFNWGNLVTIVGGVISIVITYSIMKGKVDNLETARLNDEKINNLKFKELESRVDTMKTDIVSLEKEIGKKLDKVSDGLHQMAESFSDFKVEMYKRMSKN